MTEHEELMLYKRLYHKLFGEMETMIELLKQLELDCEEEVISAQERDEIYLIK